MEKDRVADYQKLVQTLRNADIRAELYLGSSGMKAQMKYADRRGSPCVVIQGGDERAKGEVTLKDLVEGAKAAAAIKDNKEWKEARPAQIAVKEADLVAEVRKILARHERFVSKGFATERNYCASPPPSLHLSKEKTSKAGAMVAPPTGLPGPSPLRLRASHAGCTPAWGLKAEL